jgi:hypothetical protein
LEPVVFEVVVEFEEGVGLEEEEGVGLEEEGVGLEEALESVLVSSSPSQ